MKHLRWAFLAAGGAAIAIQVSLLRELTVDLAGDETAVGIGLAAWLLGIAAGAWLARRRATPGRAKIRASQAVALLLLWGPLAVAGGRCLRWLLAPPPGELLDLDRALVLALATLGPGGFLVGFSFTSLAGVAAAAAGGGEGVAKLYVWESLGSLAAGLLVSVVLAAQTPLAAVLVAAFLAGGALSPAARAGLLAGRRAFIGISCAALLVFFVHQPIDRALEALRFAGVAPGIRLRSVIHTPYQQLLVGGDEVQHVYSSGQYAASFPDPTQSETLAHTVTTFAPRVERVLTLGGVETGALKHLLRCGVESLTIVDPDRRAQRFLARQLPPEDREALTDPRVRFVADDPRRFLARTGETYDLILLLSPDPLTLLRARLTTVEFHRLCAARLEPDGVLVASLSSAPNVLTAETKVLAGSLFRALAEAFPAVRATPGPDGFLVAGKSAAAATLDPAVLAARWRARAVPSQVFSAELLPLLFPEDRVRQQEQALDGAAHATRASRDDRPVSFLYAVARRQAIAGGWVGRALAAITRVSIPALAIVALAPSLLALVWQSLRRGAPRARLAAQHVVAATGAAGMTWSLLVLFSFQTRAGALYGQLGLLTALFMLGLAAGGFATRRAAADDDADRAVRWLKTVAGLALVFAVALPLALPVAGRLAGTGALAALCAHGVLLLLAGLVTGSVFPVGVGALLAAHAPVTDAAGRVEALDHLGAAISALAAAVLFAPLVGIAATAWLIAAILGLAFAATFLP